MTTFVEFIKWTCARMQIKIMFMFNINCKVIHVKFIFVVFFCLNNLLEVYACNIISACTRSDCHMLTHYWCIVTNYDNADISSNAWRDWNWWVEHADCLCVTEHADCLYVVEAYKACLLLISTFPFVWLLKFLNHCKHYRIYCY